MESQHVPTNCHRKSAFTCFLIFPQLCCRNRPYRFVCKLGHFFPTDLGKAPEKKTTNHNSTAMPAPSPPSGWNLLTAAATALSVQLYRKKHAEAENPKDFAPPARIKEEGRKKRQQQFRV